MSFQDSNNLNETTLNPPLPTIIWHTLHPNPSVCPQSFCYLHPAIRGIAVVLSHSDAIVGGQPGQLCTQEAFDRVYWFISSSKVPEFDFPVTPCRCYEMTVEKMEEEGEEQMWRSVEESGCPSFNCPANQLSVPTCWLCTTEDCAQPGRGLGNTGRGRPSWSHQGAVFAAGVS